VFFGCLKGVKFGKRILKLKIQYYVTNSTFEQY